MEQAGREPLARPGRLSAKGKRLRRRVVRANRQAPRLEQPPRMTQERWKEACNAVREGVSRSFNPDDWRAAAVTGLISTQPSEVQCPRDRLNPR